METKRKIIWDESVYDPVIKRPCECMCCNGCKTNSCCGKFGANICPKCDEWRCELCYNFEKNICKHDLHDWSNGTLNGTILTQPK